MTERVGQQPGNYQLIHLLGEGGFAEVYLGEHIHLGTSAAIGLACLMSDFDMRWCALLPRCSRRKRAR